MLSYKQYYMGFSALGGMELNFCSLAEYNAALVQKSPRDVKEYLAMLALLMPFLWRGHRKSFGKCQGGCKENRL